MRALPATTAMTGRARTGALVAASLALHGVLLLALAQRSLSTVVRSGVADIPPPAPYAIPITLAPLSRPAAARRPLRPERTAGRIAGKRERRTSTAPGERLETGPAPSRGAPGPAGDSGIAAEWSVRPVPGRTPGWFAEAAAGDCSVHATAVGLRRRGCALPDPRQAPPPHTARDSEHGAFAEQARANDAWRDYTRGEGAYPGLRSLFKHR